jgi:hypothetical protein
MNSNMIGNGTSFAEANCSIQVAIVSLVLGGGWTGSSLVLVDMDDNMDGWRRNGSRFGQQCLVLGTLVGSQVGPVERLEIAPRARVFLRAGIMLGCDMLIEQCLCL